MAPSRRCRIGGVGYMLPMMESWLAEVHTKAGENETALSIVEGTLSTIGDVTGRAWEAELHRQKAQILLALNASKVREAESCLKKSIEVPLAFRKLGSASRPAASLHSGD
jgi:hypothetical protein